MKRPYLKRIADSQLEERLQRIGAVLIEGPKWCGKTRTAEEHSASAVKMQDPAGDYSNLKLADTDPKLLLEGEVPRLIDEWQLAPVLWDAVRYEVDERGDPGQFILTGSAKPPKKPPRHSGAGRISRLMMRPMALFESLESNGSVSLKDLFDGKEARGRSDLTVKGLALAILRGGWPATIGDDETKATGNMKDFMSAIMNEDISDVDGVKRNPETVKKLLLSLSRNISTMTTTSTVTRDMSGDDGTVSEKTVSDYINALRRLYIVEDVQAWNPAVRSGTAVRTAPKRHFVDPSIAVHMMRMPTKKMLEDLKTFGFLFESMCVRDLRVYAQMLDGEVFHYRDGYGLEADIVIRLDDGRWAAAEAKLGSKEIEDAAKNLLKLKDTVDTEKMGEPSFLMVLTAGEYGYRRPDGVFVIPAGCLKD
ncbi:MAG: DUF4143 domain-containing protein [Methanomassiliicoccaceae archaeon]|nr:DUF4143 domain-containing protein [Methanomassiliicoccaceae archaeon]